MNNRRLSWGRRRSRTTGLGSGFALSVGAPVASLEAAANDLLGNAPADVYERIAKPVDDDFRNESDEFHSLDGVRDGNNSKDPSSAQGANAEGAFSGTFLFP